jgi:transcriptional regulator with XRE-family HTH domain
MVNIDDFIKRLEQLMDYYGLNASAFADKINVQRSSISHLLSGRNKPSLDFVMKICDVFPNVNLYWILNGKENFLKSDPLPTPTVVVQNSVSNVESISEKKNQETLFDEISNPFFEDKKEIKVETYPEERKIINEKKIYKIVIFFQDGTFESFTEK